MTIDWLTVSAQIVNFLILVGLLRHFLYRPVLWAMDRREARIAGRLNEADAREREADERAARQRAEQAALDARRETLLAEAGRETEARKRQLLEEVRTEIAGMRASWRAKVEEEQAAFLAELRRTSADAVQAAVRKALADLADAELETQILRVFVARLERLDPDIRAALARSPEPARVETAFPLEPAARAELKQAIRAQLTGDREVVYGTGAAPVCGIELSSGGLRVSWSLRAYLDDLSARVAEALGPDRPASGG